MRLQDLTQADVLSVYSGRPGCCCGCRGKHSYASATRDEASAERGYAVADDEVSDRSVATILRKVLSMPELIEDERGPVAPHQQIVGDNISVLTETRQYIVFLRQSARLS